MERSRGVAAYCIERLGGGPEMTSGLRVKPSEEAEWYVSDLGGIHTEIGAVSWREGITARWKYGNRGILPHVLPVRYATPKITVDEARVTACNIFVEALPDYPLDECWDGRGGDRRHVNVQDGWKGLPTDRVRQL